MLTLHEYLAVRLRDGQMLKVNGSLCHRSTPTACAQCFPEHSPADFFARRRYLQRAFEPIDHFISPSQFLMDRYVHWGLPQERFSVIENGLPSRPAPEPPSIHDESLPLSFAFFGQYTPYKGLDVLLSALAVLPQPVRERIRLELHGIDLKELESPAAKELSALIEPVADRVVVAGRYQPE